MAMAAQASSFEASPTADGWINAMASRLAHLKTADEATVWEAVPTVFPDVMGVPCDTEDGYHCALAGAVVEAVRRLPDGRLPGTP